jgi:hypothetical protein
MALQLPLLAKDTLVGEAFPEAYCKVEFVRAFKADSLIWVNFYANGTARADMKQPVKQREYTVPTEALVGANIIAASYEYLKSLPEFAGAVDVLVTPEPSVLPEPPPVIEVPERPLTLDPTQPADESVN